MGFEPTNGGFADLSLGPLGYRAKLMSIAKVFADADAYTQSQRGGVYFFSATLAIFASRKNLADSSGGVGLI